MSSPSLSALILFDRPLFQINPPPVLGRGGEDAHHMRQATTGTGNSAGGDDGGDSCLGVHLLRQKLVFFLCTIVNSETMVLTQVNSEASVFLCIVHKLTAKLVFFCALYRTPIIL